METLVTTDSKALAAAYTCQSKDDVRFYLNGIYIEPADNGINLVATDGHRMIVIHDSSGECAAPIILQFESTSITKMRNMNAGKVTVSGLDLQSALAKISGLGVTVTAKIIDGRYPDYKSVIPTITYDSEKTDFVPFNPGYLRGFADAAKVTRVRSMAFLNNEKSSAAITIAFGRPANCKNLHLKGVLMPTKNDPEDLPLEPGSG